MRFAPRLESYRLCTGEFASAPGEPRGLFEMPGPCGLHLIALATDGNDDGPARAWEHVSVSTRRRIPNWIEMCFVKDLFWVDE